MSSLTVMTSGVIIPRRDQLIICNLEKGDLKTAGGLILFDDNMSDRGIRPRWAQVYAVGTEVPKFFDHIAAGQYILLKHGHWTHIFDHREPSGRVIGLQIVTRKSIEEGVLGVQNEMPDIMVNSGYKDLLRTE